jgi:hypothetical protein
VETVPEAPLCARKRNNVIQSGKCTEKMKWIKVRCILEVKLKGLTVEGVKERRCQSYLLNLNF